MNDITATIWVSLIWLFFIGLVIFMWQFSKGRGFNPWCWCLTSLLGWFVIFNLPSPKAAIDPSEAAKRAKTGNVIGVCITLVVVSLQLIRSFKN